MEITDFVKIIFSQKERYSEITRKDKEIYLFKFNEWIARIYPKNAEILNRKNINKEIAVDIWFNLLKSHIRIPDNFYPRYTKKQKEEKIQTIKVTKRKK